MAWSPWWHILAWLKINVPSHRPGWVLLLNVLLSSNGQATACTVQKVKRTSRGSTGKFHRLLDPPSTKEFLFFHFRHYHASHKLVMANFLQNRRHDEESPGAISKTRPFSEEIVKILTRNMTGPCFRLKNCQYLDGFARFSCKLKITTNWRGSRKKLILFTNNQAKRR